MIHSYQKMQAECREKIPCPRPMDVHFGTDPNVTTHVTKSSTPAIRHHTLPLQPTEHPITPFQESDKRHAPLSRHRSRLAPYTQISPRFVSDPHTLGQYLGRSHIIHRANPYSSPLDPRPSSSHGRVPRMDLNQAPVKFTVGHASIHFNE